MGLEHLKCLLWGPCFFCIFNNSGNNTASWQAPRLYNSYNHCKCAIINLNFKKDENNLNLQVSLIYSYTLAACWTASHRDLNDFPCSTMLECGLIAAAQQRNLSAAWYLSLTALWNCLRSLRMLIVLLSKCFLIQDSILRFSSVLMSSLKAGWMPENHCTAVVGKLRPSVCWMQTEENLHSNSKYPIFQD